MRSRKSTYSFEELEDLLSVLYYDETTGFFYWKMPAGTINARGYVSIRAKDKSILAHRLAWMSKFGNIPEDKMIDHINGNKIDNRISNLRLANKYQNATNKEKHKGKTSKYKGVVKNKYGKFEAYIRHLGKGFNLGTFKTEEEAAKAYDKKALELHQSYARINFSCKHEPEYIDQSYKLPDIVKCKNCRVELIQEWKVKS